MYIHTREHTTAFWRSSNRAMHGRPAIPPGPDAVAEGLFGEEPGLMGDDVEVGDDGEGDGSEVPTSALLSFCICICT